MLIDLRYLLLFGICLLLTVAVSGQRCSMPGQAPVVPYGVGYATYLGCGSTVFVQDSVPACSNSTLPVRCQVDGMPITDKNPNWYFFVCSQSGSLGFIINPMVPSDNYNWMLFDVTNYLSVEVPIEEDVEEPFLVVYTNPSLVVGGNWSEKEGKTGTSVDAEASLVCPTPSHSPPYPSPFSAMPYIKREHAYLLLVSHNKGSVRSGYTLSFGGGSAVIADTTTPHFLKRAQIACNGKSITVFLKTKLIEVSPYQSVKEGVKAASLAPDGSDFKLLHTSVKIKSASTGSSGFFMKKLTLHLDGTLKQGFYTLVIQKGSDGNTLLNKCGKAIPPGDTLDFFKKYIPPTPMRSFIKPKCASKSIKVAFSGKIKCNSIANDGSDFSIVNVNTGKHWPISGAEGINCENNLTDTVQIYLAAAVHKKGTYHLILKKGTDGNSVLNECDVASTTGQALTFTDLGGVSAIIDPNLQYECNKVKVNLSNPGKQGTEKWEWSSSSGETSHKPSFSFTDTSFKTQNIKLKVSNGNCSAKDSIQLSFNKDYYLHADFSLPSFVCPQDPVQIKNKSRGTHISQWNWSFGNGTYSHQEHPDIQHYPVTTFTKKYPIKLMITNSKGCRDTAIKKITISNTCDIYVPSAFTPDNDGKNDYLHPLNAFLAKDLSFKVYNRFGQLVFQTKDWTHGWDGTFHGKLQPEGSYIWVLHFINSKTGKKVFRKGASLLIR